MVSTVKKSLAPLQPLLAFRAQKGSLKNNKEKKGVTLQKTFTGLKTQLDQIMTRKLSQH